jgi:hypothetical protein
MKVGQYKGRRIAVFTRDEHCPPHVHLDGGDWSARFEFSFWHNGVSLLDVIPDTAWVSSQVRNDVIAIVKERLFVARESWMEATKNTCLENQAWDEAKQYVVKPNLAGRTLVNIQAGTYDPAERLTVLHLADHTQVGIKL